MSQHEAVRGQLVAYLGRSASGAVSGASFSPDVIVCVEPDILVLDLSQIGWDGLRRAIVAVQHVGARFIALASIREPADESAVVAAGGRYCLKSAGPGDLADIVRDLAGKDGRTGPGVYGS
jgi:hypothetical protein